MGLCFWSKENAYSKPFFSDQTNLVNSVVLSIASPPVNLLLEHDLDLRIPLDSIGRLILDDKNSLVLDSNSEGVCSHKGLPYSGCDLNHYVSK